MSTLAGLNDREGLKNASQEQVQGLIDALTGVSNPTDIELASVSIIMSNLPTSDPSVTGQLWANSGVVTVSAG